MPIGTIGASILTGLGGALIKGVGASQAAKAQAGAARDQLALQERMYDESVGRFQPYAQAGQNALNAYNYEMGLGTMPEGYGGMQASPAYQFMLNQGVEDIQSSAAARGGLYSGATGTALERYRQGLASQESNNWLNRLASMSNAGQSAAGMQAVAGQNFAAGGGQAYANIGNARAARAIGIGDAISGGIDTGLGMYGYLTGLEGQ